MMGMLRMMKTRRLIHINKLMEITVEKGVGNVQLSDMTLFANCKCQEKTNGCGLNDRTKGFVIVNAFLLMKSFCNKTCFVLGRGTARGRFKLINPFATNNRSVGGLWNELPCPIEKKCSEFTTHGSHPFRVFGGSQKCGWLRRERGRSVKTQGKRISKADVMLSLSQVYGEYQKVFGS